MSSVEIFACSNSERISLCLTRKRQDKLACSMAGCLWVGVCRCAGLYHAFFASKTPSLMRRNPQSSSVGMVCTASSSRQKTDKKRPSIRVVNFGMGANGLQGQARKGHPVNHLPFPIVVQNVRRVACADYLDKARRGQPTPCYPLPPEYLERDWVSPAAPVQSTLQRCTYVCLFMYEPAKLPPSHANS